MALVPEEYSAVVKVRKGIRYPDLVNSLALRNLPKETAAAEGWPVYYMPAPCANGHTASRFVKNDLCVDCWRVRQGRETLYPTAKNRTYYKQRDPAAAVAATGAPVVIAPPAPVEPSKVEQKFLAALDELRDFDAAAAAVGWTRGLVESRASSNPVFKAALEDLISRRGISWTRAPDSIFTWSEEVERNLVRRFIDTGLLETARNDLGCPASEFFIHLERSPNFASAIEAARPRARETLRDRAVQSAERGNDRLLKILEEDAPDSIESMNVEQLNAELEKLITQFKAQGLFTRYYVEKSTGRTVDFDDCIPAEKFNADLVGAA